MKMQFGFEMSEAETKTCVDSMMRLIEMYVAYETMERKERERKEEEAKQKTTEDQLRQEIKDMQRQHDTELGMILNRMEELTRRLEDRDRRN